MNKMAPVVHFEMPYDDPQRLSDFYARAFGWHLNPLGEQFGNYVLATTAEGDDCGPKEPGRINGGFFPKKPAEQACGMPLHPNIVISVDDLPAAIEAVRAAGGKILGEPMTIPEVGDYICFFDTEGNRVAMLKPIPGNWHSND